MAKKKGGGKKGGKKGAVLPSTMAVGGMLMGNGPPSNFPSYKNPPAYRPPPALVPSSPSGHRVPPGPPPRLPIAIVRAASNGDVPSIVGWLAGGGGIDTTWDSPADRNVRGFTLLMLASLRGHEPLVDTLLKRRAATDAQDGHGATALVIATAHGRHAIVALLLKGGARTDLASRKGGTALDFAEARDFDVIAQLIRTAEVARTESGAKTLPDAIAAAAKAGSIEEVVEWLDCGGGIDAPCPTENAASLLMLAASCGKEALVAALLARGASTEMKRLDGSTALMIAAYAGERGVVRQLVMYKRPPTVNYEAITTPIAGVPEYALEFRASGRWRSAPSMPQHATSMPTIGTASPR